MKIAVVGDIMLDRYIFCTTSRICPEAPVPIALERTSAAVLGGAGNVYNNLRSLGAEVLLCGRSGIGCQDASLIGSLIDEPKCIIRDGSAIVKERIISQGQQLLRIDREEFMASRVEDVERIVSAVRLFSPDAIIVSDYAKGVVTQALVDQLRRMDCLLVADPKKDLSLFDNFDMITPNKKEYYQFNGEVKAKAVLVTLGEGGMALYENNEEKRIRAVPQSVCDVTGAGDTVVAAFTYFKLSGYSSYEAAQLANAAAGIVVNRLGTSVISLEDMEDHINPFNRIRVVEKVWGGEVWFANSDLYCGKILNLKQGYRCSDHYHMLKDETFYLLSGKVSLILNGREKILNEGDSVKIKPYDVHSFQGIENSTIVEVSTNHSDDDSYRETESGKWDGYKTLL